MIFMASNIDPQINSVIQGIFKEFEAVFKAHGGGAELVAADSETVILRLKGHCDGCVLAPLTFGLGIEKLIRQKIPTVKEVRYTK